MKKVAFQGEHGAYSEVACFKFFGKNAKTTGCKTFREVFESVRKGRADYGIVPIENSTVGPVYETYDLLMKYKLKVCGEAYVQIRHCLIGNKGAGLKDIKRVYSHAQALGQCDEFLSKLNAERFSVYDTAGAARMIKGKKEEAAIAGEAAARVYGLKVIKKGIETNRSNTTRFFVISKKEKKLKGKADKTSIVIECRHVPGALFRCLGAFEKRRINLTKIESRPMPNKPWEYLFYLDFGSGLDERKTKLALEELKMNATNIKILGTYKKG